MLTSYLLEACKQETSRCGGNRQRPPVELKNMVVTFVRKERKGLVKKVIRAHSHRANGTSKVKSLFTKLV